MSVAIGNGCRRQGDKPLPETMMNEFIVEYMHHQRPYSPSRRMSYRQISWSLEAARLGVTMIVSF